MASQGSQAAHSSSASGQNNSQVRRRRTCYCGERPVLVTSSTAENPGRRFWECVNYGIGEECEYFVWIEPEEDLQVARLKRKVTILKDKLTTTERMFILAVAVALVGWTCAVILLCERITLTKNGRFSLQ